MSALKSLEDQQFGSWIVLYRDGSDRQKNAVWMCKCACGTEKRINSVKLVHGRTTQCFDCAKPTMGRPVTDLTGQVFGKRTVLGRDLSRSDSKVWWLWRCEDGHEGSTSARSLRLLHACKEDAHRNQIKVEAPWIALLYIYQKSAHNRGHSWELSDDQAIDMFKMDCFYCGLPPASAKRDILYTGIDRKDPKVGYTVENTVPACSTCNRCKQILTTEEFYGWLDRILEFRSRIQQ